MNKVGAVGEGTWSGRGRLVGDAVLLLIILAGAALRLQTLQLESLWYDELYVVWARKLPLGELLEEIYASEHPPVYNVVGHYWNYFGHNEFWVRSPSAIIGTATIALAYLLARELFSRRAGLWSAAFTAASPLMVWYSRDATSYAWVTAISLASLYLLVRCCRRGGAANWTAYALVTVIAVFSHLSTGVLVLAEAVFFLVLCGRERLKPWLLSQSVVLLALATMLVTGRSFGRSLDAADPLAMETLDRLLQGLVRSARLLLMGYMDQPAGSPAAVLLVGRRQVAIFALTLLVLGAPFVSRRVRQVFLTRGHLALALAAAIMTAGPLIILLLRDTDAAGRYIAWAAPPLLILMAAVISAAPRRVAAVAGGTMVAGLLLVTAFDLGIRHNENYDGVMSMFEERQRMGDIVYCFPQHNCVVAADFYLPEKVEVLGGFIDPADPNGVYVGPEGKQWSGYTEGYLVNGELLRLEGKELRSRTARELGSATRFWLITGDGTLGHLPSADGFEASLPDGWVLAEVHDLEPLVLKLYVRDDSDTAQTP